MLFFFSLCLTNSSKCQLFYSYIDFESPTDIVVIDTTQTENIWQIGIPSKTIFNSGYNSTNAIVTDTIFNYPINNTSIFEIKIVPDTTVPFYGYWGVGILNFWHKYDMDLHKDGGFVEIKYDNDTNWTNVIFDSIPEIGINYSYFYNIYDTISGNIPAFTGTSNTWIFSQFEWYWCMGVKELDHDSIIIRFVFKSDSTNTNQEGWLIDDISMQIQICTGGLSEIDNNQVISFVSPNPVTDISYLQIDSQDKSKEIFIYNSLGILKKRFKSFNKKTAILKSDFDDGIYFYNIYSNNKIISKGKFIIY